MERLGLEDDVAIESKLVSKTIESAQSRVEGFNFDIRKRVVEYDDVINKQRETIYAERDKVLRNEDLTETVREFLDEEIEALVDASLRGRIDVDEWDLEGWRRLRAMGLEGEGTSEPTSWGHRLARGLIVEHLREARRRALEAKEAESARPTGRRSSAWSCCGRSTRCGSST
jgi:preprotein translocase subunit SecA